MSKFNVAVIGATGAVGMEMLNTLAERQFPVDNVYAIASLDSIGKEVAYGEEKVIKVDAIENFDFSKVDIALFSAGSEVSKMYAHKFAEHKCVVIDNSSCFRMDEDVPLVVPEVNNEALDNFDKKYIVANPNCAVIQMVVALKPLHDVFKIKRIVASTYQSVSGAGREAMDELFNQTRAKLMNQEVKKNVFNTQIAFNLIPHIGGFTDSGETEEEVKVVKEIQKILDENVKVSATCVRVPVFVGHCVSINVEFENKITAEEARKILKSAPGIAVYDDKRTSLYATPLDVVHNQDVIVSRIREDESVENGLNLWVVADNLRKGAALNAVQIAEELIKEYI